MFEQNKMHVRCAVDEAWNGVDFTAVDSLVAADIIIHGANPASDVRGPEGIRQLYGAMRHALPLTAEES
jgi:SnoaL-like domain